MAPVIVEGEGNQVLTNPFYWGSWSDWSECSSTCGHGVTTRRRRCLMWQLGSVGFAETWRCQGRATRRKLCHKQACESEFSKNIGISDDDDECRKLQTYNLYRIKQRWRRGNIDDACKVICRELGGRAEKTLSKAKDGTRCSLPETDDAHCQDGNCEAKPQSCSDASGTERMDMCLICGGDNSSCYLVQGNVKDTAHVREPYGIKVIARVPQGSTFINILKTGPRRNTLALVNSEDIYVVNGRYDLSEARMYKIEGATWTYENDGHQESLTATGPTVGDVTIMLYETSSHQAIAFSFWIPSTFAPRRPRPADRRQSTPDDIKALILPSTVSGSSSGNLKPLDEATIWNILDSELQAHGSSGQTPPAAGPETPPAAGPETPPEDVDGLVKTAGIVGQWHWSDISAPDDSPLDDTSDVDVDSVIFLSGERLAGSSESHAKNSHFPDFSFSRNTTMPKSTGRPDTFLYNFVTSTPRLPYSGPRRKVTPDTSLSQIYGRGNEARVNTNLMKNSGRNSELGNTVISHDRKTILRNSQDSNRESSTRESDIISNTITTQGENSRHWTTFNAANINESNAGIENNIPSGKAPEREDNTRRPRPRKKDKRKKNKKKRLANPPEEDCFPCPRATNRAVQFCESDFVSKVYVNRRKIIGNDTRYDVTVMLSYRNRVSLMQREFIWVESRCKCPRIFAKRTYILMGKMESHTDREARLVLDRHSFIRGFSVGQDRKLRRLGQTLMCNN